jgi:hypothetical protein
LYFKKTAYNWLAFSSEPPPSFDADGERIEQTQLDVLEISDKSALPLISLLLNGKLAFLYWYICGDDFHVTKSIVSALPVPAVGGVGSQDELSGLHTLLRRAMEEAVSFKLNAGKRVGNYNLAKCRNITDRSDHLMAQAFQLDSVWDEVELFYTEAVKTDFELNETD